MFGINTIKIVFPATWIAAMMVVMFASAVAAKPMERLIRDATSATGAKRIQAVEALGDSGDLRALQPLLNLLNDADPTIRDHALKALQTLTQSLRRAYAHLAQWIDSLLLRLDIFLAPEPPVERTRSGRVI